MVLTRWAPAFGIVSVIFYYALFLWRHALNIPYADDIVDALQVMTRVVQSNDISQTLQLFFAQYVDHRIFSSRLVYYLLFLVTGEINFRTLILLANMGLFLILLLVYLAIRHRSRPLLILFPAALILFQLRAFDLLFWSQAALAYIFVYAYALACLSCLRKVNVLRFVAAVVFAALASFSLASGQLIWIMGLASLLHQSMLLRRIPLVYAYGWLLCAVIILLSWYVGYETNSDKVHDFWRLLLARPLHPITHFLTLTGNAFSRSSVLVAASAGLIMLCIVTYSSVRRFNQEDLTLEFFAWYIIFSLLAVTFGRAVWTPIESALSSRSSLPSILLLMTIIAGLDYSLPMRRRQLITYVTVLLLCAFYWESSFQTYRPIVQHMLENREKKHNLGIYWCYGSSFEETSAIVTKAVSLGIYTPPAETHPQPSVVLPSNQK